MRGDVVYQRGDWTVTYDASGWPSEVNESPSVILWQGHGHMAKIIEYGKTGGFWRGLFRRQRSPYALVVRALARIQEIELENARTKNQVASLADFAKTIVDKDDVFERDMAPGELAFADSLDAMFPQGLPRPSA